MMIFVYMRSGIPARADANLHSITGDGIGSALIGRTGLMIMRLLKSLSGVLLSVIA
jgi:hypothetical protein